MKIAVRLLDVSSRLVRGETFAAKVRIENLEAEDIYFVSDRVHTIDLGRSRGIEVLLGERDAHPWDQYYDYQPPGFDVLRAGESVQREIVATAGRDLPEGDRVDLHVAVGYGSERPRLSGTGPLMALLRWQRIALSNTVEVSIV